MQKCCQPIRLQDFEALISQKLSYWRYKVNFLHAATYLLTLQNDGVILDGRGQACPGMPKEDSKILISRKLMEV